MSRERMIWLALLVVAGVAPACAQDEAVDDERLAASRSMVAELQASLQAELSAAMEEGGPAAAVAVCRDRAPQIASELARKHGAVVGRTSLRTRNPTATPAT